MNVYCVKCGSEMEIMRDLGSELRVYPCGCGGKGKQKRQPTKRAIDEKRASAKSDKVSRPAVSRN